MPNVTSSQTFVPREGEGEALLALLTELRGVVTGEPGNLSYTVHRAIDPARDGFLVIQVFESADAFRAHGARMASINGPQRIAALVATPPQRPELFAPVADLAD